MIQRDLLALGFETIIFLHDFYEIQSLYVWDPKEVLRRMMASTEKFKKAYHLLQDELSKEIFCRLAQVHLTRQSLDIPFSPRDEQYFPSDIPLNKGHHTYVCCGAYDGENIRLLRKKSNTQTLSFALNQNQAYLRICKNAQKSTKEKLPKI